MAPLFVLLSGWLGLTFAIAGEVLTDATMAQFFGVWMVCGLTSFTVLLASSMVRGGQSFGQTNRT